MHLVQFSKCLNIRRTLQKIRTFEARTLNFPFLIFRVFKGSIFRSLLYTSPTAFLHFISTRISCQKAFHAKKHFTASIWCQAFHVKITCQAFQVNTISRQKAFHVKHFTSKGISCQAFHIKKAFHFKHFKSKGISCQKAIHVKITCPGFLPLLLLRSPVEATALARSS